MQAVKQRDTFGDDRDRDHPNDVAHPGMSMEGLLHRRNCPPCRICGRDESWGEGGDVLPIQPSIAPESTKTWLDHANPNLRGHWSHFIARGIGENFGGTLLWHCDVPDYVKSMVASD